MNVDDLAKAPLPTPPPMSAALEAAIVTLAPVAPRRPLRQLAILVGISVVYGAVVLALVHVRRDLSQIPMAWIVGAGLAWFVGFIVPAYLATVPAAGAIIPRWRAAAIVAAIVAVGFVIFGLTMPIPAGSLSDQFGWPRFLHGHTCLEIGLATALVPVVAGAIFLRGALPVGARWTAAALGAAGGCFGGCVLHFHCYITDHQHHGLVHGGVVVVAALLSAAIVPRAQRVA